MTSLIRKHFQQKNHHPIMFYIVVIFFFLISFSLIENLRNQPVVNYTEMTTTQHKIDTGEHKGMANFTINNDKYDKIFSQAAAVYDVDCTLLKAVMLAESQGHPWAKSHVGAVGLMQLMPSTAYSMGYRGNLFNPETNIMAGAAYLRHLTTTGCYEKIENNVCDMRTDINYLLAAYNGGSKANKPAYLSSCPDITAWQCPLFYGYAETRNYVNKVKANYDKLWQNNWQCL